MIKVGIFGAASLTAGKLIKLLLDHPAAEITIVTSRSFKGQSLEASHTSFKNLLPLKFEEYQKNKMLSKCDVVFLSKPHCLHIGVAEELLNVGLKVIDLSSDFRLKNVNDFVEWYKPDEKTHNHYLFDKQYFKFLEKAVYGLPEIYSAKIMNADLVANPGCYPTSVILGLAPLFKKHLVSSKTIIVDSYSGITGAGKSRPDTTQFIDLNDNVKPYKLGKHQHTPEMEQELSKLGGLDYKVLFTPHVIPINSGIISTIYFQLNSKISEKEIFELFSNFYINKKFVRVYEPGSFPQLKDVINTNFCDIGITFDKRTGWYIVTSVIDNLIKGAVGQAIQNMNLMYGLDETEGLPFSKVLTQQKAISVSEIETL